ncbi:hypothetical protein XENOCAPTIV_030940, partial [Xenoophorus captivus]
MFNRVPISGKLSVGDVVKVLEKRFPYVEVSSVLGGDSSYDSNRKGELATDHDVVDFIMTQPNVVPRINSRVLSTSRTYLDLSNT